MRRRDGQRGQTTTEYLMISGLMTTIAIYILQRMQEPFRQRLQDIVTYIINGVADPNKMTQDEIEAAKETMIRAKPQIRMFWGSESEAIKEAVAGNLERPQNLEVHALSPGPSYHGLRAPQNGRFARVTGG